MLLLAGEAAAAQKTYQYFRFEPKRMQNDSSAIQLSEFTFSLNGSLLNLANRNGSGLDIVPVTASSGAQDPGAAEGPGKVLDGKPLTSGSTTTTKWFNGNALTQPLDFAFTAPVTVDAYNFATGNDSATYARTPISWFLYGRNSTSDPWVLLDARNSVTVTTVNNTYQAGYTIPEEINPVISYFRVQNTNATGTAAIVRDDDVNGVMLEWDTSLGDVSGTSISPAPGAVAQVGSVAVDPPDNATTTYTVTASKATPPAAVTQPLQVRSVVGGTSSYQYIRFKATKLRSGLATGTIQLAEFGFLNNGSAVAITGASQTGANTPAAEGIAKLWDGIATTTGNKWLDFNNAAVVFDLGVPDPPTDTNTFTHYFFYTANDAVERDPIQWTLEGSDDQDTWTLIDNVNFDYPTTPLRNTGSHGIPLPGASLPPSIKLFTGDGTTIYQGTPLILTWDIAGAATASIDQGIGTVPMSGTVTVTPPLGTTTYTLTGSSAGAVANSTGSFTVTVIAGSAPTTIAYADFNGVDDEFQLLGSTQFAEGKLRLTSDVQNQRGEAWFRARQDLADGFESSFGLSMTHTPNGLVPADGVAFVIHNAPQGSATQSIGEGGVTVNSLNIKFKTFGFNINDASQLQVLTGTTSIYTVALGTVPGITYKGVTGYPYSMVGMPGTEPYRVRVVYVPGSLDIYVNEVAVAEDVFVDLSEIGAVDASGAAFVGFSARTGGNTQQSDITYWTMRYGDFTTLPSFGLVKGFNNTINNTNTFDLVWNAESSKNYLLQSTADFITWDDETSLLGEDGQIGVKVGVDTAEPKRFYRVKEED